MFSVSEDYLEGNPIWVAELSNKKIAYETGADWLPLQAYCQENNVYIEQLKLRFRSHWETLPKADGYTFIKSVLGSWGLPKSIQYYIFGFKTNDEFYVQKWRVPELIMEIKEHRDYNQYKGLYISGK